MNKIDRQRHFALVFVWQDIPRYLMMLMMYWFLLINRWQSPPSEK